MIRKLTAHSSLESLKKAAKRWLKELRAGDPEVPRGSIFSTVTTNVLARLLAGMSQVLRRSASSTIC